jgi:hypothetical protein
VYQRLRPPDGGEGTSSGAARRAGPGHPRTGRGRGRGRPRRDPPPPLARDQSEEGSPTPQGARQTDEGTQQTEDEGARQTDEGTQQTEDEGARQTDEGTQQTEDSSAQSTPYLRGPTSLPSVPLPDRRPVVRPVGRR